MNWLTKNTYCLALGIYLLGWACLTPAAAEARIPRIVLALYDSHEESDIRFSRIHTLAELPLNHLGMIVKYHDIRKGLPTEYEPEQIRGVITWFSSDVISDPQSYLSWAKELMTDGKRFVVLGELGVGDNAQGQPALLPEINKFLRHLGVHSRNDWIEVTYDMNIVTKNPYMVEFEYRSIDELPPFLWVQALPNLGYSYLTLRRDDDPQTDADLVATGPSGGYVASGYTHFVGSKLDQIKWYINPFEFFRQAFATDEVPKPDTTTLTGRRIYYSHIDGDGWRNVSLIPKYRDKGTSSAEVILKEILRPNPDLPTTVGPVVADLDPKWFGNNDTLRIARAILSLPHVEAGSHTYSHPFYWQFYQHYNSAKERRIFRQHYARTGQSGLEYAVDRYKPAEKENTAETGELALKGYDIPRAYAKQPFRLAQEISGSISYINRLLPPGKRVELIQWSGDTTPYRDAMVATKEAKVGNINGGDSRFDGALNSHAWISPLGIRVGNHWQIYASNSNENTYTENWTERYFGFKHLVQTLQNTETPVRLKPINLYYHMYSGERTSSLAALQSNLEFIRRQEIAPITASHYAATADGFFSTTVIAMDKNRWRFENRGALQTIRFDHATLKEVDFSRSEGVIGQRHYQGSLYVALDASHAAPVIALTDSEKTDQEPAANRPYLIQSRWRVFSLESSKQRLRFKSEGFGPGEFLWKFPQPGDYKVITTNNSGKKQHIATSTDENGLLSLSINRDTAQPTTIEIFLAL